VIAAAGTPALWYLTRGAGAVALLLLTASVVLGVVHADRRRLPGSGRLLVESLHRTISLLVLAVLAVHVATSVLDTYAPIRLLDAVVPFASAYRPLWVGLGALALDLLLALTLTSVLRGRLGFRSWRAIHWLAYACWPVAVAHGLGSGSDARSGWMLALTLGCVAAGPGTPRCAAPGPWGSSPPCSRSPCGCRRARSRTGGRSAPARRRGSSPRRTPARRCSRPRRPRRASRPRSPASSATA
jgi:hypothetical protein